MPNAKKATSPAYEALVADLLTEFPDLEPGALFGMPCLKSGGKAVLSLPGSALFDPSGKGRPMKDWVVVSAAHEARWGDFAAASISA
jgi:hypothetical protein